MNADTIIKRPRKVVEIDGTETDIVVKSTLASVKIRDEVTDKLYRLIRTRNGMQMTGI
jgi:hypothetical protein